VVAMALRVSSARACPRRVELEAWGVEGLPLWEGSEPAALIASWFAFTTGELWALAGIKRKEIHAGNSCNEHNE